MNNSENKRSYFNLVIGVAFIGYGGYRLFTFYQGEAFSSFRLIIAVGFVILGSWDLYKFFRQKETK